MATAAGWLNPIEPDILPSRSAQDFLPGHVLGGMPYDPVNMSTLVTGAGLEYGSLSCILLRMETQGQISKQTGRLYIRNS